MLCQVRDDAQFANLHKVSSHIPPRGTTRYSSSSRGHQPRGVCLFHGAHARGSYVAAAPCCSVIQAHRVRHGVRSWGLDCLKTRCGISKFPDLRLWHTASGDDAFRCVSVLSCPTLSSVQVAAFDASARLLAVTLGGRKLSLNCLFASRNNN